MLEKFHPFYYLGAFVGAVIGFVISKIYLIWAILYQETNYDEHKLTSWYSNNPPLWDASTRNPSLFTFIVTAIFIVLGVLFVKVLFYVSNKKDD